ncbi:hypothetical protein EYF80_065291 [Liparis tanakae]|uniref:Uncharacterized protein n=1 Tax=Liparis tanakae TaxID=230148 RepID=A0A4Z2E7G2_9TELE|nr:hypothetical protein EYF80_065291 [Liparis tanakae]
MSSFVFPASLFQRRVSGCSSETDRIKGLWCLHTQRVLCGRREEEEEEEEEEEDGGVTEDVASAPTVRGTERSSSRFTCPRLTT